MAITFSTDSGTLIVPGAYSQVKVQTANAGLATTGVLMLVGEADQGPDWSLEPSLEDNAFGPDQLSDVVAKYKSGNLVDAFRAGSVPSADDNITGAPSRIILVKTNVSPQASSTLLKFDSTSYGSLKARSGGKLGNLIYYTITSNTSETIPTTGSFTLLSPQVTTTVDVRANGGAKTTATLNAADLPPAMVSAIDALSNVACSGGANRSVLPSIAADNLAVTLTVGVTNGITISYSGTWTNTPSVGDMLYIPSGSAIAGLADANIGSYVITSADNNDILAVKLLDATGTGNDLTAPVAVSSTPMVADTDFSAFAPVVITQNSANPIDGVGKSLEVAEGSSGEFSVLTYALSPNLVTWVSTGSDPELLTSASEYSLNLNVNRQVDGISEVITAGGEIALKLGYQGTTATVTITSTTLSTTVSGGSGSNLSITLADFPTLSDLANYINAQTGYVCEVGTVTLGQIASTALDRVSGAGICTTNGVEAGRIKIDAYRLFSALSVDAVVQLNSPEARAAAGLPAPLATTTYLSGGAKGATSNSAVTAAIDALEKVRGNFLVPLFSRDASSDIGDGLTDSSSSYTIDSINAYAKTHVLKMSTLKKRRNRQAFLSSKGTFTQAKTRAANLASARCSLAFEDCKNLDSAGNIKQFQPWMTAVLAAGMQAAGFYRPIVHKFPNASGFLQAANDFDPVNDSQVENALLAGLLPLRKDENGTFFFISDQTTYSKDTNFVFNSIQAMYLADVAAMSAAKRFEAMFVGQSLADINANIAVAAMQGIMQDFLRLKIIAPSDDAPNGFKGLVIKINGPVMTVSCEIKLAGALYFSLITFSVTQITQTATG